MGINKVLIGSPGPDIWFEYVQFAMGWIGTEDGQQKIREIMERALTAVGIHVVSGAMLWDTYREFENTVLMTLQVTDL